MCLLWPKQPQGHRGQAGPGKLRLQSTTVILLNRHNIKPSPNDLSLYSVINASINSNLSSFYLQQTVINTDPQLSKVQRIGDYRTLHLKCDIYITSPLERLRGQCGRQDRKAGRARAQQINRRNLSSRKQRPGAHMNSQRL